MMSRFVFFIELQTEIKWENNRPWENNHASLMSDVRAKRNADHKSFCVHPYFSEIDGVNPNPTFFSAFFM